MKKNIADYLHLYLGCKYNWESINGRSGGTNRILSPQTLVKFYNKEVLIKPLLRSLSSITEEEQLMADKIHEEDSARSPMEAQLPFYLLSKGFDLFGLIESGLALDKTQQP